MASIISAGTTSGTSLNLSADTSGVLQLATNGTTTAVTIDTSQNVGIGTASPTNKLHVQSANSEAINISDSAAGGNAQIKFTGSRTYQVGVGNASSGFAGVLYFYDATTAAERMRIPATGGLQVVNSISVGNATPTTSGAGITFPATQSASSDANTLDDYEEGTWTPTGNGITYSTAVGSYIKVGRMVMATFNVTFPSTADGSGAQIKSLPFTVTTGNSYQSGAYVAATDSSTAKNSNFTISGTTLIFRDNTNSNVANSSFSTKFVQGTAMYFADA